MGADSAVKANPLGTENVRTLMIRFAIPSIIAMLVSAIYNIVDQLFIGHAVGTLGNAATNVAFPLTIMCTSIGLLFGIGGASNFNLQLGRGDKESAPWFIGNSAVMMFALGTILGVITELFTVPMLKAFGSPNEVLPYALSYVRITAIGFPFLILTTGGGHLMRADGSPRMTMLACLSGAVINTFLDALFVFGFHWGMAGAAAATIIGQIFSACLVVWYLRRFRTVPLKKCHFVPKAGVILQTMRIGVASCLNQLAMMVVQIALNNSLKKYGVVSVYGESIPIAVAGIGTKVNQIFLAMIIGLAQGSQPVESFNYGAKNYGRVREAYKTAIVIAFGLAVLAFVTYQLFPRQIISLFGSGSEEYYSFGVKYFRIYLFFTWANCLQPVTATLFTSIGKAIKGVFLSLTRQILFLLPLILILPVFLGIEGILYAGPVADMVAALTCIVMAFFEFNDMRKLENLR